MKLHLPFVLVIPTWRSDLPSYSLEETSGGFSLSFACIWREALAFKGGERWASPLGWCRSSAPGAGSWQPCLQAGGARSPSEVENTALRPLGVFLAPPPSSKGGCAGRPALLERGVCLTPGSMAKRPSRQRQSAAREAPRSPLLPEEVAACSSDSSDGGERVLGASQWAST